MESLYKVGDWLRLKGQSNRESAHIIEVRKVNCCDGSQNWYTIRLVRFDSYESSASRTLFVIHEIEIAQKIEEPIPK